MFTNLSGRQKVFLIVFLSAALSFILVLFSKGLVASLLVLVLVVSILFMTKPIWLPEAYGRAMVRRYSLQIIVVVATSFTFGHKIFIKLILYLQEQLNVPEQYLVSEDSMQMGILIVFLFVLSGIFIVNYLMRDRTTIGEHSKPIDKEFPQKDYKSRLNSLCGVLLDDLNKMDRESNWSSDQFIALDAEVEVRSKTKRKKIAKLLNALKRDKSSKVFLILGDPGSGKSVSLRKLAKDLLKEVPKTGKVPLYINLKEWEVQEDWNESNPPTPQQLFSFVQKNIKDRLDVFSNEFLDVYFMKMFESGRFFIILDSFDEIPAVLDVDESSWLINKLSAVIYQFLGGAHESRGVLSSRFFRKPTDNFQAASILEIRPFSEIQITETLKKSINFKEKIVHSLFKERPELVPLARNPFSSALILNYAKENDFSLPDNQSTLYESYIYNRLKSCREKIQKRNLTEEMIIQAASDIAEYMFKSPRMGLEIQVSELKAAFPSISIDDILDILTYSRIGRVGSSEEKRFSFVHRRFNEYFVAKKIMDNPEIASLEAIPTDSRWREALVLYCELCSNEEAHKIVNYCWNEVEAISDKSIKMSDPSFLRAIHSLRFLNEAFRSRTGILSPIKSKLALFVHNKMESGENLLITKLSIESVGILSRDDVDSLIIRALKIPNHWINESAIKSCRHLSKISESLENRIIGFIFHTTLFSFFLKRKELLFSFSLSDGFLNIKKYCRYRILDFYLLFIATVFLFIINPLSFIFIAAMYYLLFSVVNNHVVQIFHLIEEKVSLIASVKQNAKTIFRKSYDIVFVRVLTALLIFFTIFSEKNDSFNFNNSLFEKIAIIDGWFLKNEQIKSYSSICLLILSLMIIPWADILYICKRMMRNYSNQMIKYLFKSMMKPMLVSIPILALAIYLISQLPEYLERIFVLLLSGVVIVPFIVLAVSNSINYYRDLRILKRIEIGVTTNRKIIAENISLFRTVRGRSEYIKKLEEKKVRFSGQWPDDVTIFSRDDEATTLLAKLEEKMLGFDL